MRYDDVLRRVAQGIGGRLPGDDGTKVAHSIKDLESLNRKADAVVRERGSADQALLSIGDLNRYTLVLDPDRYTAGVERARELLAEHGLSWERGKNTWDDPIYKGYNVQLRDPSLPHAALDPEQADEAAVRHPVEVQFHTPESLAAKDDNHGAYRLVRSGELGRVEERAANELRARRSESVVSPPGYERLADPVPPQERPRGVTDEALQSVRDRLAAAAPQAEPERAPPGPTPGDARTPRQTGRSGTRPPADDLRGLTPERSPAGGREELGVETVEREGLER